MRNSEESSANDSMVKRATDIDLEALSKKIREARERKDMTLEELSHTLWAHGFPTSQNKLWRMENKPPKRVDSALLLWLEKVLEVSLVESEHKQGQVLKEEVIALIDQFIERPNKKRLPKRPRDGTLEQIYERLATLVKQS